jgi:hypothetical protein
MPSPFRWARIGSIGGRSTYARVDRDTATRAGHRGFGGCEPVRRMRTLVAIRARTSRGS